MKFAVSTLAVFLLATLATAGDCLTPGVSYVPQYTTGGCCGVQASAVYQQQAYAPVQQVVVQRQVYAAPVYVPQVQQVVVQRQVYQPAYVQQAFVQKQVVVRQQAVYGYGGFQQQFSRGFGGRQFNGGGFGGGPFRQGFQQGGILGGLERFTGLGNGSGDFGRGAIIGVLGARSNLFGLGRGR
jgi:hypothetical protein